MSPNGITRRLSRMGMEIDAGHIYSAAAAAADYVLESFKQPRRIYNLASEGMHELLDPHVQWVEKTDEPCDAVVAGSPVNRYAGEGRRLAALALLRKGAKLIGLCADRVYPSPRGMEFGVGSFCAMLAYAANVAPIFVGKPQEHFFRKLCEHVGVNPADCVLIGDNIESDIVGAKQVGMKTIITLTGVATRQEIARLPASKQPDAIIDDLTELLTLPSK